MMIRLATLCITLALAAPALGAQPNHNGRAVAVAAVSPAVAAPAPAAARWALKPEIMLTRDLVTFGDLISGLPADVATMPAFRAPALGETGTIQVARIAEAARGAGFAREATELENQGFAQVVVTRSARRVTAADLEAAVKLGLQERFGVDASMLALAIDGGLPAVSVEPELTGEVAVLDLGYDQRSRRIQARFMVPGSAAMRLKPLRITGQLVETVEVVVPKRAITRGETLSKSDVVVERRPRDGQSADLIADARAAIDKVARRGLPAGLPLRAGDVQREEIVAKGDLVTIVYEAPGLMITLRGRSSEAGAMGDVISITNPQSKRVLQGTVSGPGRVSVQTSAAGRVASAP
jgi:flagella basal body P-ring formation protein FlgA